MNTGLKPARSLRPTLDTPFHIDYDWWAKAGRDLRIYMRSHLCAAHRSQLGEVSLDPDLIDWVDPQTAEVKRRDGLVQLLHTHCALQPDYITEHTSIVDAAFRLFLTNDNQPLTPRELAERLSRDPDTILRTIGGRQVYQGLRPA